MNVNPVFVNELRQSMFRRKPVQALLLWMAATGVLVWLAHYAVPAQYSLTLLPMFVLPMIAPAFAAGTFAKEYEQQTWQDLYLTRLTNLQVVLGKFLAALLMVGLLVLSFIPALILVLQGEGNRIALTMGWWLVPMTFKLLLSAALYVVLGMVCSRYSATRRAALAWCYVAMFLYAMLGAAIWSAVGAQYNAATSYSDYLDTGVVRYADADLVSPGFMQGIHLIFCAVVGLGSMVLLWVSLSEQRGYKGSADADTMRAWQPISRQARQTS